MVSRNMSVYCQTAALLIGALLTPACRSPEPEEVWTTSPDAITTPEFTAPQAEIGLFVSDFGALGDGVTDDSQAIQAAVDAALPGQRIIFNSGFAFRLAQAIEVSKWVILEGYGATIIEDGGSLWIRGTVDGDPMTVTQPPQRNDHSVRVQAIADFPSIEAGETLLLTSPDWFGGEYLTVQSVQDAGPDEKEIFVDEYILNRYDSGLDLKDEHCSNRPPLVTEDVSGCGELGTEIFVYRVHPIRAEVRGLTFESVPSNGTHLRLEYVRPAFVTDATFTGSGTNTGPFVSDSSHVTFADCRFHDVSYKGLRFVRVSVATVRGSTFERNSNRPLLAQFSTDVSFVDNQAKRNEGFIFAAEASYIVNIESNIIDQVPLNHALAQQTATSRPGIFIIGSENVNIVGNQVRNCIGEGDIYLRSSNYIYGADLQQSALPMRNINVVGNIIDDEVTDVAGNHGGAIYVKWTGADILVANNTIRARTGIFFEGDFERLQISDNHVISGKLALYLRPYKPAPRLVLTNIEIHDNWFQHQARHTNSGQAAAIGFSPDSVTTLSGNRFEAVDSTGDSPVLGLSQYDEPQATCTGMVRMHGNLIQSDAPGGRGAYFVNHSLQCGSMPVERTDNEYRVPGIQFYEYIPGY